MMRREPPGYEFLNDLLDDFNFIVKFHTSVDLSHAVHAAPLNAAPSPICLQSIPVSSHSYEMERMCWICLLNYLDPVNVTVCKANDLVVKCHGTRWEKCRGNAFSYKLFHDTEASNYISF